jgi:hypothetical protein
MCVSTFRHWADSISIRLNQQPLFHHFFSARRRELFVSELLTKSGDGVFTLCVTHPPLFLSKTDRHGFSLLPKWCCVSRNFARFLAIHPAWSHNTGQFSALIVTRLYDLTRLHFLRHLVILAQIALRRLCGA